VFLPGVHRHELVFKKFIPECEIGSEQILPSHATFLADAEKATLQIAISFQEKFAQFAFRVYVLAWVVIVVDAWPLEVEREVGLCESGVYFLVLCQVGLSPKFEALAL